METPDNGLALPAPRRRRGWLWALLLLSILALGFYWTMGFYSIQPIGAMPDGATVIVWRNSDEPFFNSPDALCLERMEGVSLLCRGMAMAQAPKDRIVLRLPYQEWAYLESTGGRQFDR
jgi:hypothetical protein